MCVATARPQTTRQARWYKRLRPLWYWCSVGCYAGTNALSAVLTYRYRPRMQTPYADWRVGVSMLLQTRGTALQAHACLCCYAHW